MNANGLSERELAERYEREKDLPGFAGMFGPTAHLPLFYTRFGGPVCHSTGCTDFRGAGTCYCWRHEASVRTRV